MATVYLAPAPTGDDTRTYAQAQNPATPWLTIAKCFSSAVSGDTVSIAAGTYTWASAAINISLTLVGPALSNNLPTAIFDGAGVEVIWAINASVTLTLQKLTFQNAVNAAAFDHEQFKSVYGISPSSLSASQCCFRNCTVCEFTGGDGRGGFFQMQTNLTLTGCVFYGLKRSSAGVSALIGIWYQVGTVTLTGCTYYHSEATYPITYIWDAGFSGTTASVVIKNCIFQNVGGAETWSLGAVLSESTTYCDHNGITSPPAGAGNITSNPLLVDAANANFNLRPTSPCLGTGIIV